MDTSLECEWRLQERKDQPPQTAVNLSYYKRPVSCVDWTPLTISFQVHTKGNFAEPHFEGEWFSFGIHIQGPIFDMSDTVSWSTVLRVWSCAWPSSCYELTTRGGLWWPEWWLIHQKKILKDPGKVFASFSTYNCPKSNGGVFDRSVWIITLWSCGYAKPFCLNGPPRQSLDIFEGKQKPG